jgi:hypothetical protein
MGWAGHPTSTISHCRKVTSNRFRGSAEERLEKIEKQVARWNLLELLEKHPELKERFEMILDIVENVSGEVEKADEAERRAIEAVRQLGNEIVHGWAQRQQQKKENECDQREKFSRKEKKRSTGSRSSEKSR